MNSPISALWRTSLLSIVASTALLLGACSGGDSDMPKADADTIEISSGWVALPPPGADRTAGYMTIANGFEGAIKLVGASTGAFGRVELHTMAMVDDVMQMRPVDGFTIEGKSARILAAGGDHLMMLYPRDPLTEGQTISVRLAIRDTAGELVKHDVEFEVRAR